MKSETHRCQQLENKTVEGPIGGQEPCTRKQSHEESRSMQDPEQALKTRMAGSKNPNQRANDSRSGKDQSREKEHVDRDSWAAATSQDWSRSTPQMSRLNQIRLAEEHRATQQTSTGRAGT
jgi:hypothetical protein